MDIDPEISLITVGNASDDQDNGWFIGQFVSPEHGLRQSEDIEIRGNRRVGV